MLQNSNSDNYTWQRSRLPVCPLAPTSVPKLQVIASVNVTVALWNHVSIPIALPESDHQYSWSTEATYQWGLLIKKVRELANELPVPYSVAENIKKWVSAVGSHIDDWVRYHIKTIVFNAINEKLLYYHVPHFAWYPDGTINYEQTARNLQSSLRLSFVEKYKFLCTYCLKKEIARMVPSMRSGNVKIIVEFSLHPLIHYWNCFFTNQLHKIPVYGNVSLDSFMFQQTRVDNWPAKRYFFDRLSSQEKIRNAIQLIDSQGKDYQRLIFMKLSKIERTRVYTQRAHSIMMNYLKVELNKYSLLLFAWIDMRSLITDEQFSSIFYSLLKSFQDVTIKPTPYYSAIQVNSFHAQNLNLSLVLQKIWTTASDNLRNHLIEYNDYEIINKIFELPMKNIINNDLLFTVLSNVNAYKKKKILSLPIFNLFCDKLLAEHDLQAFDRLLNMFLPHDQNLAQFREHFVFGSAFVRNECLRLYSLGHVNPVNGVLSKLLPTTYHFVISEYKTNLLVSPDGIVQCVQNGILNLEENTINEVMADGLLYADLICEFKRNLVISPAAVKVFQEWILNNQLNGVINYIDNYLTSDEERSALKKRLLAFDDLATAMVTFFSTYDDVWIRNLLEWCAEDDKKGREFRSTLPIDDIFNRLLKQAVFSQYDSVSHLLSKCVLRDASSFTVEIEAMNRFLKWYFELEFDSYEKIKEYKLRRICSYNELDVIKTLLKKKDDCHLRTTLAWFFDNDDVEKQKFRDMQEDSGMLVFHILFFF